MKFQKITINITLLNLIFELNDMIIIKLISWIKINLSNLLN